ncbi:hypothetical protein [Streptomyces sp. SID12501]|uniref:Uncharacterized protein n=1 Tax=Streptomyces sp. SID12501 TaxID=2706042 RepID=A0A6B3BVN5_9ACTN|nr:hypothetical protein [Streptomyces sp. SID12501]NEC88443.1 hypothetical protein [Streptomyces sp. SID12501]
MQADQGGDDVLPESPVRILRRMRNDGTTVGIPVTVTEVTDSHITWEFCR